MPFFLELLALVLAIPIGLGVGGGGLFLLSLTELFGFPREEAVFGNLLFFVCALAASAVIHLKRKRLSARILLLTVLFGLPSATLGRWVASLLSPTLLRVFLGVFLLGSGLIALFSGKKEKASPDSLDKNDT